MAAGTLLLDPERKALVVWLLQHNQISLNDFLELHTQTPLAQIDSVLQNMGTISFNVVAWAESNPARLVAIIQGITTKYPGHASTPTLQPALNRALRITTRQSSNTPWRTPLAGMIPVVNRAQLRTSLEDLVAGGLRNVILVHGVRYSGRSHSWHLIQWVARATGNVKALKVDAEKLTLDEAFTHVSANLGVAPVVPTQAGATPETIAARYVNALLLALAGKPLPAPVWLAFDAVDRPSAPELGKFICQLTQAVLDDAVPNVKVFLLGADRKIGIDDQYLRAAFEPLARYTDPELTATATEINTAGLTPLADADLATRIAAMTTALKSERDSALRDVADLLVALREEVDA